MGYGSNEKLLGIKMSVIIKLALALVVAVSALYPYLYPVEKSGALETVFETGLWVSIVLAILFLAGVALYCKDLERSLTQIQPENRKASPRSVWYMFVIPYNIIEDFFIILNVYGSVENELKGEENSRIAGLNEYSLVTGMGWCIAQVLSLIPNLGGQLAGFIALMLWIAHWILIRRINHALKNRRG